MNRTHAQELADLSAIIDREVERLLRKTAINSRRLEQKGLRVEAATFRRQALDVVSRFVDDMMVEARQSSAGLRELLDEIRREAV